MAGEDLLEDSGSGDSSTGSGTSKKHKPLSKPQKIGVAIGVLTIILVVVQIERSKSASTATAGASTPIDPETGYPEGSAEDQAALAALESGSGAGSSGGGDGGGGDGGVDPATGQTYSSEIGALGADYSNAGIDPATGVSYSSELSTLGTNYTNALGDITSLQQEFTQYQQSVKTPAAGKTPSQNLANLESQLARDEKGTSKGDVANRATLKKQIAAVKSRK